MGDERIRYIRSLQTLVPLHEHTDALALTDEGRIEIQTRLPAPSDQYGIPRPEIMVSQLLALMNTENYVWPGQFDEHHLATPKADFTVARSSKEGDIGSAFRGLACLKIDLPRQMHNFAHAVFELPGRPPLDVMHQAVQEVGQAKKLQSVFNEFEVQSYYQDSGRLRQFCISAIQSTLESMKEPELGMLPPIETMARMELTELHLSVRSLLRVRRFSKKHLIHPAIRKRGGLATRTAA